MSALYVSHGSTLHNKYGAFPHDDMIGKPFGSQISSSSEKGTVILLKPTPELWTRILPHRTQILYMPDISLISSILRFLPGSVVVESGTGSGSFSHSIARTISPTGKLLTFEYHEERVNLARNEFEKHGLADIITVTHRNVCKDGFQLENIADSVFLDLPSPWEAIASAKAALKRNVVARICTFSPAIEQVQRTCEKLCKNGFTDIFMFETLIRGHEVKTLVKKPIPATYFESNSANASKRKADDSDDEHIPSADDLDKYIVSRPFASVSGHTSYLVFATILVRD